MNKVLLVGRLTRDPDIGQTANNITYARFSVAVNRRYTSGDHPEADFPSVVAWGKTAEFIEKYFQKGQRIGIEGRIQTGSYTNKDGQKIYTTDVVAENVEFVESKSGNNENNSQNTPPAMPTRNVTEEDWMRVEDGIDAELPFN